MKLGIVIGIVAAVLILTVGAIVVSANVSEETNAEEVAQTSCGCGSETCTGQCGGGCGTSTCGCGNS